MNFVIDIGNSYTKLAVFDKESEIVSFSKVKSIAKYIVSEIYKKKTNLSTSVQVIIGSVSKQGVEVARILHQNNIKCFVVNSKTPIPIKNLYQSTETLGIDRLAAVVGAHFLSPHTHNLVFDAGTALTIDFITKEKEYFGGNISPGLNMRFKALHAFTDKLPLCEIDTNNTRLYGRTTNDAIILGVQNGILFEMEQYISSYFEQFGEIRVFLTGGDIFFFENKLKRNIFANPNLVLIGLNQILEYNATFFSA
jgi:type III pantothenate kinase